MIKLSKSLAITILVVIILVAFVSMMSSREKERIRPPIELDDRSAMIDTSGVTDVKGFYNTKKDGMETVNKTSTSGITDGALSPTKTPKPLPYPRISINYSVQQTSSIGDNDADVNSTFVIVMLDIRNYGYIYFDAFQNNFRGISRRNEIRPLVNISTGNTIDAVIPNNSRAKGDLLFLISKKEQIKKITYSPINKSENYYIIYTRLSPSEMEYKKEEESDEDEGN